MNNCGCKPTEDGDMLLVKATASTASTCMPSDTSGTTGCAKQEPMYDISLNDFLVPSAASITNMTVCNGSPYTAGMWLDFVQPSVKLRISSVNGNIISLINQCSNGLEVDGNPDPGQVVSKNAKFVVADAPTCMTDTEKAAFINDALVEATQLCVPALEMAPTDAVVHLAGRVESSGDLSIGKCIRRVFGIFIDAGRPFFTNLAAPVEYGDVNYRPLVKHKTTHEVVHMKHASESGGMTSGERYIQNVSTSGQTKTRGYVHDVFHVPFPEAGTDVNDTNTWVDIEDIATIPITLTDDTEMLKYINALDSLRNHYFVMVRLELAANRGGAAPKSMQAKLNGKSALHVFASTSADYLMQFNSASVPIKIMKSDNLLTLEITTVGTAKYLYRLSIDGILK